MMQWRFKPKVALIVLAVGSLTLTTAWSASNAFYLNEQSDCLPQGVYLHESTGALANNPVRDGQIIRVCPPASAATLALSRGYDIRWKGSTCSEQAEPFLKEIVATAGQIVNVTKRGVTVDGHMLPNSKPYTMDPLGRHMPVDWGRHAIKKGHVWLWAQNPLAYDSRYYGQVPVANIKGYAKPLWTDKAVVRESY
jgi:conjugative transfer signal peptidase TraF